MESYIFFLPICFTGHIVETKQKKMQLYSWNYNDKAKLTQKIAERREYESVLHKEILV